MKTQFAALLLIPNLKVMATTRKWCLLSQTSARNKYISNAHKSIRLLDIAFIMCSVKVPCVNCPSQHNCKITRRLKWSSLEEPLSFFEIFSVFYWYKTFVTNLFTHVSIRPLAELFHLHNSQRELAYKLRGWFRPRSNREVWLFLPNLVRLPFSHGNLPLDQNHPERGKPGQSLKWHPPTRSSTRDHTDIVFFCRYRPLLSIPSHRQGSTKIDTNYRLGTFHHCLSHTFVTLMELMVGYYNFLPTNFR